MVKINLAVIIYTYDRVADARINQDIIREYWSRSKLLRKIRVIHSYDGPIGRYPHKYKEDDLIRLKNPGHFQGAADLIDAGWKLGQKKYQDLDYVVVLAADTWLIDIKYLEKILREIQRRKASLATCAWGLPRQNLISEVGVAADLFIIDCRWARRYRLFPIGYDNFYKKYADLLLYKSGSNVSVEKLLLARYIKAVCRQHKTNVGLRQKALSQLYILKDRQPVHSGIDRNGYWLRKMYWPKMGLLTHHDLAIKRAILKRRQIKF